MGECLLLVGILATLGLKAANLIQNGDFSKLNAIGCPLNWVNRVMPGGIVYAAVSVMPEEV